MNIFFIYILLDKYICVFAIDIIYQKPKDNNSICTWDFVLCSALISMNRRTGGILAINLSICLSIFILVQFQTGKSCDLIDANWFDIVCTTLYFFTWYSHNLYKLCQHKISCILKRQYTNIAKLLWIPVRKWN